ncbi:MAG: undecaprenyldiphospho-muramoylpentapeptide beta-N-acetylglucosaminyltransferase, partial [Gemmatimonadetes bacterium]|nr:undecaprenyldiphospho-muramoylpentapeptide beta-N-acetylglucosaminyltransferase [Gemmatimonadota bacterium]
HRLQAMIVVIAGGGTGGHLMPALALAEALRALRPDVEPVLMGARRGVEAALLPKRPFRHHLLALEPLYRGASWWKNWRLPVVAWRAVTESREVLARERPSLVVGTGGYAAGPVLLAARWQGIPIALQEQNALPGLTTRLLARWATQVHLGFPEAERHLRVRPATRVFAYGNPITPPPSDPAFRERARAELGMPAEARVLLVIGGSQGSRAINQALTEALESGALEGITLLWSTGAQHFEAHQRFHAPPKRQVRPFWDPISTAYGAADLVIARAGAMTTAELCAYGLPAILVPLPTAAANHQVRNAQVLASGGAAIHLPERDLSGQSLGRSVTGVLQDAGRLAEMAAAARARGQPRASKAIAEALLGSDPREGARR